ncbi:ABC transporter substrate-binding protein [Saccharopolyspora sp. NFXS83]|uniref:ABC transporter substrate-binding protein n=1 Tax=Saccharopolyspora sp. NFXS83 TaxID=2993560 RepID=UPI00224B2F80|nr:ABC transporter substrate-binding protein [Saccharopolyspora sp. NFXS83]MCX2729519.1 ABC transporter substrate-binding protein [Saccharopolyspora sp. NFXS83]
MRRRIQLLISLTAVTLLASCGTRAPGTSQGTASVTVTNCGSPAEFPAPAQRLFINDSNMISMVLALGAEQRIAAVSSMQQDVDALRRHYGPVVDELRIGAPEKPSRETVLAQRPDVVVAGWNYGYSEANQLTPDGLRKLGIAPYVLTESCRQPGGGSARGIVEPWRALHEDLTNLGTITGHTTQAEQVTADLRTRLDALRAAPQAPEPPTIFVFDSAGDTVFSSGNLGGPQAIVDAAGGRNALDDVRDTWTKVSWERVAASDPDAFVFVDYPPQSFQEKVAMLKARPGINRLRAITEERFVNLPYALWTSGPLNIDAAEQVREELERWGLVPPSSITPRFDDRVGA